MHRFYEKYHVDALTVSILVLTRSLQFSFCYGNFVQIFSFLLFAFKVHLNLLKRFSFRFRDIEVDEKHSEKCETSKEPERPRDGESVDEHVKWKSDKEGAKPVEESGNTTGNSFGFHGEYLTHYEPSTGTPSHRKSNDIHGDACYSHPRNVRATIGYVGIWYGIDCNEEVETHTEAADTHSDATD